MVDKEKINMLNGLFTISWHTRVKLCQFSMVYAE